MQLESHSHPQQINISLLRINWSVKLKKRDDLQTWLPRNVIMLRLYKQIERSKDKTGEAVKF